ncbi:hypothetical protein ACH5RR_039587 [Cinchona calisaya]|uniref:Uncharacterized protein n=1 Tax=Cinchona calisaya TaxID=153742 RepID=A0ABD2Y3Z9_9GENT
MSSSREARRRRIVDRGTDRLALITGQIRALPSDAASDSDQSRATTHSHTASCPPSISQLQFPPPPPSTPSESLDSSQSEDKAFGALLTNLDTITEASELFMSGDRVGPIMRKCESSMEADRVSSFDLDGKRPSLDVPSTAQDPRVYESKKDQHFEPISHLHKIFAPKAVKLAISATESTRTLCSLVVAVFVVLAYVGFPVVGSSFVKSFIFFRPLYLLLLTNITIVVARLLEERRGFGRPEQQATSHLSVGENGLADQLGNALELGFLLQDVTGALFMDCGIYAITVICGLSFARGLGW